MSFKSIPTDNVILTVDTIDDLFLTGSKSIAYFLSIISVCWNTILFPLFSGIAAEYGTADWYYLNIKEQLLSFKP